MNQNPSGASNIVFQLRSMLQSAQSILIALPDNPSEDATAAGLALYLVLAKMRKQITIVSPSEVKVERAHLFGIDKIAGQISGGNTLVVSLPYAEGSIEKVSYNIENNRFNLVIEPRGKALSFNPDQIEYNYGKGEYDLVFVLGASDLPDLGSIYKKHANAFSNKPIINIDNTEQNSGFGRVNLVSNAPISQIVTMLLKSLRIPLDQDPASNLYTGINSAQAGVTLESASPDSLEAIAFLLRSSAKLLNQSQQGQRLQPAASGADNQKDAFPAQDQKKDMPQAGNTFTMPPSGGQVSTSSPAQEPIQKTESPDSEETPPEDWLKPKIFTTQRNPNRSN